MEEIWLSQLVNIYNGRFTIYSVILPQVYFPQNHVSLDSESARNGQGTIDITIQV